MTTNYPERRHELQGLMVRLGHELSGSMSGFANLHKAATTKGALDTKAKELIALGIAVAIRCEFLHRIPRARRACGRRHASRSAGNARRRGDDGRRTGRDVCL